jgi:hypothetical protein
MGGVMKVELPKGTDITYERSMAAHEALSGWDLSMAMFELMLDTLKSYEYVSPPPKPTILARFQESQDTQEWKEKSPEEKKSITKRIYAKPEIELWVQETNTLIQRNFSNAEALEEMIRAWKEIDPERAKRCWQPYSRYPEEMKLNAKDVLWRKKRWKKEEKKDEENTNLF